MPHFSLRMLDFAPRFCFWLYRITLLSFESLPLSPSASNHLLALCFPLPHFPIDIFFSFCLLAHLLLCTCHPLCQWNAIICLSFCFTSLRQTALALERLTLTQRWSSYHLICFTSHLSSWGHTFYTGWENKLLHFVVFRDLIFYLQCTIPLLKWFSFWSDALNLTNSMSKTCLEVSSITVSGIWLVIFKSLQMVFKIVMCDTT